jgi:hypothetical protein
MSIKHNSKTNLTCHHEPEVSERQRGSLQRHRSQSNRITHCYPWFPSPAPPSQPRGRNGGSGALRSCRGNLSDTCKCDRSHSGGRCRGAGCNNASSRASAILYNSHLLEHLLGLVGRGLDREGHALSTVVLLSAEKPWND